MEAAAPHWAAVLGLSDFPNLQVIGLHLYISDTSARDFTFPFWGNVEIQKGWEIRMGGLLKQCLPYTDGPVLVGLDICRLTSSWV